MDKFYELKVSNNNLMRITHNYYSEISLLIFNFEDFREIQKTNKEEFSNGVYFIKDVENKEKLYIGQTSNGLDRFNKHSRVNKSTKFFFFNMLGNRAHKSMLEEIEREVIKKVGYENSSNRTTGNKTVLSGKDEQYSQKAVEAIEEYMELFDFKFANDNSSEEFIYFDKKDNSINYKSKGDIKKAIIDFAKIKNGKFTKKDVDEYLIEKFQDGLDCGRWKNVNGLKKVISRDLQQISGHHKESKNKKQYLKVTLNEKGFVEYYEIIK